MSKNAVPKSKRATRWPDESQCETLASFLVVFSNAIRLKMFCQLQHGPKTVTELAEGAAISLPNASQHLRLMRDKGAVTMEKEGQRVYYTMADRRLAEAMRLMRDALHDVMQAKTRSVRVSRVPKT